MFGVFVPDAGAVTPDKAVQNGDWSNAATWSSGVPSNASDPATIDGGFNVGLTLAGETATLVDAGTASGQSGTLSISSGDLSISNPNSLVNDPTGGTGPLATMRLGQQAGSTGTLTMSGGSVSIHGVGATNPVGSGFAIGDLLVGDNGTGVVNMTGGTFHADDEIHLGLNAGSSGTVNISGGTMDTVGGRAISAGFGGSGDLEISGTGTVNAGGDVFVNFLPGSTGTLGISGNGTLNCNTLWSNFSNDAGLHNSTINQTGGAVNARYIVVLGTHGGATSTSVYNHSGGTLTTLITNPGPNGDMSVGDSSNATYNISGTATTTVGRNLILGAFGAGAGGSGGNGTINMTGGSITTVGLLDGHDHAVGHFNQSAGAMAVTGNSFLGSFDSSFGNYSISGGSLTTTGNFSVGGALADNADPDATRTGTNGQAANANGTFTVSGSKGSIHIGGNLLANPADKDASRKGPGLDNSATLNFEILDGTGTSLVNVAGVGDLDGALVDVKLLNGFTPAPGQKFNLITALGGFGATGTGTTQNVGTGEGFILSPDDAGVFTVAVVPGAGTASIEPLVVGTETLQATYVPEPTSLGLLGIAAASLLRRKRRA
jgi:hypothetical protein